MSCAEDDHGGTAVQSVPRSHNLPPRLSKKYFTPLQKYLPMFHLQSVARREGALVRLLEDGEDGSDGDETVDVGAAVQGVEGDDVLALALRLHLYLIVILLRPDSSTLCKEGSDQ